MIEHDKFEELTLNVNKYVKTNIELIKLEATERTSVIGSKLISYALILLAGLLLILFISLGAALYISSCFGNNYCGFIIVGGFYLIVGICLMIFKRNMLEKPLRNNIISGIMNRN